MDHLTDAHELERNTQQHYRHFHPRARYVFMNFHRYSNDTMANLMFDTQLPKRDYDRMNSVIDQNTLFYYMTSSFVNITAFSYGAYFFRFRRLNLAQVALVSGVYYYAFNWINNILYKSMVDRKVVGAARSLGYAHHVQPNGSFKNRGLNF